MTTPLYPPSAPVNGINQGLFPFKVNADVYKEWIQLTPFFNFIGNEKTRPIVRHQMEVGEGWEFREGKLNSIDYTRPIRNFDQVSGSGQYQKVDYDKVQCDGKSFLVPLKGRELISLGTPIDLPSSIRGQLVEACQRNFNKCLLDAAMFDYIDANNPFAGYAPATQLPSFDRMALAGLTTARATYNAYAGITTAWNSFTGIDYTTNGLSAKHLLKLKMMATRGGNPQGAVLQNGRIEDAIRPAFMKTRRGFPLNEYIYLCNTESYTQLLQDPMYYQATTTRGTIVEPDQPEAISGATYKGKYEGIHIYEVPDLAPYISLSQDGAKSVGWELFIGAGALTTGWFKEPWIAFKDDPINMFQEFASHEIRGEKALKFPSKQASTIANIAKTPGIEQGIIHSFVRIA